MDEKTAALSGAIVEIAQERRRFGYRRIHDLLRVDFPQVNHKKVYRLYREANLAVRKRKKVRRPPSERLPLQIAQAVNEVWSMDFVSDALSNGHRFKCLTVADDFSHECVDITADFGIGGQYVTRLLDRAALFRGYPKAVRTDNGPEFTSRAFIGWAQSHGIEHLLIEPGKPMQNGYIESFNGKFRDKCLNQWFFGMKMHIGADSQTKLIHSVAVTAANVHDKHALPDLLHGQERRVYADAGYAGQQDMIHALAPDARAFVNERAYGGKKLTARQKERNRNKSRIRARVEHAFGVIKGVFKFTKVRYRGLAKNGTRAFVACALANLYMVRGQLLRAQGA
jgi:putative transposase